MKTADLERTVDLRTSAGPRSVHFGWDSAVRVLSDEGVELSEDDFVMNEDALARLLVASGVPPEESTEFATLLWPERIALLERWHATRGQTLLGRIIRRLRLFSD
jgi:hypothetical protein